MGLALSAHNADGEVLMGGWQVMLFAAPWRAHMYTPMMMTRAEIIDNRRPMDRV